MEAKKKHERRGRQPNKRTTDTTRLIVPVAEFQAEAEGSTSEPIIPGVAYEGSGLMLYSRQGVGKTRLSLQVAHALMTGEAWLDVIPVARTGPVAFLQLDMAPAEWAKMLAEAEAAGLDLEQLHTLPFGKSLINVLDKEMYAQLKAELLELEPIALIVDAGYDIFEARKLSGDVNKQILDVLHLLRDLVPRGLLVYLLHDRKHGPNTDTERDQDAFAGPGAWERFASTSLRLFRSATDQQLKLVVRKTRFTGPGFRELRLTMSDQGFLVPELDHKSLLAVWPACLPRDERNAVLDGVTSKNDVYKDIAKRTGAKVDAVKKHAQRYTQEHGPYAWVALLDGKS